jgi:hypothetical protein
MVICDRWNAFGGHYLIKGRAQRILQSQITIHKAFSALLTLGLSYMILEDFRKVIASKERGGTSQHARRYAQKR